MEKEPNKTTYNKFYDEARKILVYICIMPIFRITGNLWLFIEKAGEDLESVKNKEWQVRLREKTAYAIFIGVFYLNIAKEWMEYTYFPFMGYLDEVLAILAIPLWFISLFAPDKRMKLKNISYGTPIAVFLFVGLAGSLYYNYQPFFQIALPQFFLWAKFWLAITAGKFMFKNLNLRRYANRIFANIKLITWLFSVLIIVDNILGIFEPFSIRYGLRSTHLFFRYITSFVAMCVLLLAILVSIKDYIKGDSLYFAWICLLMCTSLRSKSFGAAIVFILIYLVSKSKTGKFKLSYLLLVIPFVIMVSWGQISYYFLDINRDESARYQLYSKSFDIAKDHFPFGSGFGTFATHFSTIIYSPIYDIYDMDKVWGLSKIYHDFVNDSFWPAIIGETGWIGLFAYVLAIVLLLRQLYKMRQFNVGYYMGGLFIILYQLIASTAEAAFLSPLAVPFALWIGFLISQSEKAQKESTKIKSSDDRLESER